MSRHSAKNVHCKLSLFFLLYFFSRMFLQIANYQSHCIPLIWQLRICIEFFQLIDYLLHGWSRPRLSLQASSYQATKRTICYKHHLFFTPSRIWKLPDAHFTKKNTKAVNINLTTIHHLNKSIFFPWDVCDILRLKSGAVEHRSPTEWTETSSIWRHQNQLCNGLRGWLKTKKRGRGKNLSAQELVEEQDRTGPNDNNGKRKPRPIRCKKRNLNWRWIRGWARVTRGTRLLYRITGSGLVKKVVRYR